VVAEKYVNYKFSYYICTIFVWHWLILLYLPAFKHETYKIFKTYITEHICLKASSKEL